MVYVKILTHTKFYINCSYLVVALVRHEGITYEGMENDTKLSVSADTDLCFHLFLCWVGTSAADTR